MLRSATPLERGPFVRLICGSKEAVNFLLVSDDCEPVCTYACSRYLHPKDVFRSHAVQAYPNVMVTKFV